MYFSSGESIKAHITGFQSLMPSLQTASFIPDFSNHTHYFV